jgi:hypothetical protein
VIHHDPRANDPRLVTVPAGVGLVLWGEDHWRSQLARALVVDVRTVRRWEHDPSLIPPGVLRDMLKLLQVRLAATATPLAKLQMMIEAR